MLPSVGARCSDAMRLVSWRFASSGNGEARSQVRRPASRWKTGDLPVERREAADEGRRRVALDEDGVGALAVEQRLEAGEGARRDRRQRLPRLEDPEVVIRDDREELEHLGEHLPVLSGDHHDRLEQW